MEDERDHRWGVRAVRVVFAQPLVPDPPHVDGQPDREQRVGRGLVLQEYVEQGRTPSQPHLEQEVAVPPGEALVDEAPRRGFERRQVELRQERGREHRLELTDRVLRPAEDRLDEGVVGVRERHQRQATRSRRPAMRADGAQLRPSPPRALLPWAREVAWRTRCRVGRGKARRRTNRRRQVGRTQRTRGCLRQPAHESPRSGRMLPRRRGGQALREQVGFEPAQGLGEHGVRPAWLVSACRALRRRTRRSGSARAPLGTPAGRRVSSNRVVVVRGPAAQGWSVARETGGSARAARARRRTSEFFRRCR